MTPWTVACQTPLSIGFPRQKYWSRLPLPFPGHIPNQGIQDTAPALESGFFTSEPPGKHPPICWQHTNFYLEPWYHSRIPTVESASYQTPVYQCLGVPLNLIWTCLNWIHYLSPLLLLIYFLNWMHSVTSARSLAVTPAPTFSSPSAPNQFPSTISYFFVYLPGFHCLSLVSLSSHHSCELAWETLKDSSLCHPNIWL